MAVTGLKRNEGEEGGGKRKDMSSDSDRLMVISRVVESCETYRSSLYSVPDTDNGFVHEA